MTSCSSLVEKYAATAPRGRALELGAGRGRDSRYLARLGFRVLAIDKNSQPPPEETLKSHFETLRQNFLEFNMGEARYQLILAINSLHFYQKEFPEMVERIKRALMPGGRLIMSLITRTVRQEKGKESDLHSYPPQFQPATAAELVYVFSGFLIQHAKEVEDTDKPHSRVDFLHIHTILEFVADKNEKEGGKE